jgi:hypothetical protein
MSLPTVEGQLVGVRRCSHRNLTCSVVLPRVGIVGLFHDVPTVRDVAA